MGVRVCVRVVEGWGGMHRPTSPSASGAVQSTHHEAQCEGGVGAVGLVPDAQRSVGVAAPAVHAAAVCARARPHA